MWEIILLIGLLYMDYQHNQLKILTGFVSLIEFAIKAVRNFTKTDKKGDNNERQQGPEEGS
jgi:hypothetical protein